MNGHGEFLAEVDRAVPGGLQHVNNEQGHFIRQTILPFYKDNVSVAKTFIPVFPISQSTFTAAVRGDLDVAKLIAKHCPFTGEVPDATLLSPQFIEYVFREAPKFACNLPRCPQLVAAFTPELLDFVMEQVRRYVYSEKIIKRLPVIKRRVYAHRKLVEWRNVKTLLFLGKLSTVASLNLEIVQFLGLAEPSWRRVLSLIARQIY
jgi:hypothetical protein